MVYTPPPELAGLSLAHIAEQVAARKLPPVEQWMPEQVGESHMRILADGTWLHEESPISRPAMVRAFAGLLRREEDGSYWLVTPFQKLAIEVEDACFIATDVSEIEGNLAFRLNTDELVVAGEVILAQGENVLRGGRLVYNVRTETGRMAGAPTAGGDRVQGVFYPEGND